MSVSKAEYDAYVRSMKTISDAAKKTLISLWEKIDHDDIDKVRDEVLHYLPLIVSKYGKTASVVSAQYYDQARAANGIHDGYMATTLHAGFTDEKKLKSSILYALSDKFTGESITSFLDGVVDMGVKEYGRMTLQENTRWDDKAQGYVSVPDSNACAFCIMKASMTYRNYMGETLLHEVDFDAWHANCNCQLMPMFGNGIPLWYQAIQADCEDMYRAGVSQARRDTADARQQRLDELRADPEHQKAMEIGSRSARKAEKSANSLSLNEVLAGMRKANDLEH